MFLDFLIEPLKQIQQKQIIFLFQNYLHLERTKASWSINWSKFKADCSIVQNLLLLLRSFVPKTLLLLWNIISEHMAHFTSFNSTSITYHWTFSLTFTLTVFETAWIPTYAQFQMTFAGCPLVFGVRARWKESFFLVYLVGKELVFSLWKRF